MERTRRLLLEEMYNSGYYDYNVYSKEEFETLNAKVPVDCDMYYVNADDQYNVYSHKYPESHTYLEHLQTKQVENLKSIRTILIVAIVVIPLVNMLLSAVF